MTEEDLEKLVNEKPAAVLKKYSGRLADEQLDWCAERDPW